MYDSVVLSVGNDDSVSFGPVVSSAFSGDSVVTFGFGDDDPVIAFAFIDVDSVLSFALGDGDGGDFVVFFTSGDDDSVVASRFGDVVVFTPGGDSLPIW